MGDHFVKKLLCCLLVLLLVLTVGCESEVAEVHPVEETPSYQGRIGYLDAAAFQDGFLACGTGGRLDRIDIDGTVTTIETGTKENLLGMYVIGHTVLLCGTHGTLLCSSDGAETFQKIDVGTDETLYSPAVFRGIRFVAGEKGVIYRESKKGWEPVQMETEQDIISLAATDACLAAITAQTDVCITKDSFQWEYQNFNEFYDGLYPVYDFTRSIAAGSTFFVIGTLRENPNVPLIMYTETGEVWMMKEMSKINGEYVSEETNLAIHDIDFNVDQIIGVLDDGQVLSITECTVCNESLTVEEEKDLWATAVQEKGVLVCGEEFYSTVLGSKQVRQDKIKAEQARDDMEYGGAVLIDVRDQEEIDADGFIPNSIHVPMDEVEEQLPILVPDPYTEIIFYCASGYRSQTATEMAVDMGYQKVYNLGGLSDWPYELAYVTDTNESN